MSAPLVDRTALDELIDVLGTEKLARLIDRFVVSLTTAFADDARPDVEYAREAHTLISMAGMLGCTPLSQACRVLEQEAKAGPDFSGPLGEARRLRDGTITALREVGSTLVARA